LTHFALHWMPLICTVVLPLLCFPFVAAGCCGGGDDGSEGKMKFGARTALRRIMMAVRADIRMGNDTKAAQLLAKAGFKGSKHAPSYARPTATAVEAGLQKARVNPTQKPQKPAVKTSPGTKTGPGRFY